MLKTLIRQLARRCGYEIRRAQPPAPGTDWVLDSRRLTSGIAAPVVFDVGANVGDIAIRLANTFPPATSIHAFEPALATYNQLVSRAARFDGVVCHQCALGAQASVQRLYHGINSQLNRLAPADPLGDGTDEEVPVDTVDAFAASAGIDRIHVLKTDTEGFDVAVLRGAGGLLQRRAIDVVVSEASFDGVSDWHTRFDDVRDLLEPHGFRLFGVYDVERWGRHLKYCNVLFVRQPRDPTIP